MRFRFVSFILLSVSLATWSSPLIIEKRTAIQVEADIAALAHDIESLDNAVNSLPQQGFFGALIIENDVNNILTQIKTKTLPDIISTGPVSTNDADSILAALEALAPKIIQTLQDFVTQKPEVQKLNGEINGLTELAETDLEALQNSTSAVIGALISAAPDNLKPTASSLATPILAAFESAIAAYAA